MSSGTLIFIEMLVVLVAVVGWGVWGASQAEERQVGHLRSAAGMRNGNIHCVTG